MTLHTAVVDAGSVRRLMRAVPSRRGGETMLSWTRGYLLARHSGG